MIILLYFIINVLSVAQKSKAVILEHWCVCESMWAAEMCWAQRTTTLSGQLYMLRYTDQPLTKQSIKRYFCFSVRYTHTHTLEMTGMKMPVFNLLNHSGAWRDCVLKSRLRLMMEIKQSHQAYCRYVGQRRWLGLQFFLSNHTIHISICRI